MPLSWYPRLQAGTPAERDAWELLGNGYAISWPDLDEHIGVGGLLAECGEAGFVWALGGGA